MAPPPRSLLRSYKPEPGADVCGDSWWRPLQVTGEVPHAKGYGADLRVRVEPIDSSIPESLALSGRQPVGWLDDWETTFREEARQRIADLKEERQFYSEQLIGADQQALTNLFDHAEAELDEILAIYDKWTHRRGGTWPLSFGDKVEDIPVVAARGITVCAPVYTGAPGQVNCGSDSERQQRRKDRSSIKQHLLNALRWIRCAEFSMHRTRLLREAIAALQALPNSEPHKKAWIAWGAALAAKGVRPDPETLILTYLPPVEDPGRRVSDPAPEPAQSDGMSTALKVTAVAAGAVILFNFLRK